MRWAGVSGCEAKPGTAAPPRSSTPIHQPSSPTPASRATLAPMHKKSHRERAHSQTKGRGGELQISQTGEASERLISHRRRDGAGRDEAEGASCGCLSSGCIPVRCGCLASSKGGCVRCGGFGCEDSALERVKVAKGEPRPRSAVCPSRASTITEPPTLNATPKETGGGWAGGCFLGA